MQPPDAVVQPSPSFARLFSSLISSRQKRADDCDDEIDEEASALSYEQALRRHARYRPSEERLVPLEEKPVPSPQVALEPNAPHQDPLCSSPSIETAEPPCPVAPQPSEIPAKAGERLKTASITIRLTQPEYDQLRRRASEAGLTISAYLRSCTFEAESLRALVKDTLAQLQANSVEPNRKDPNPQEPTGKLAGLWPWKRSAHRALQA